MDSRPCLVCRRGEDDPLHGPPLGTIANTSVVPRIEQHEYDPGERRKLIRRMEDREAVIEEVVKRVTHKEGKEIG